MKGDFLRCGAAGWCLEIFWTGLHAVGRKEWKMMGQSSLWMFPDLWYGSMYRTYIQKYQKDPGSISGRSVHDRDLCGGIWHRNAVKTLRYVSLGLQRESSEL